MVIETVKIPPNVRLRLEARKATQDAWQHFVSWSLVKQAPRWVFRGQSQSMPLRPSIGRREDYKPEIELLAFNEFKRHAVSHFDTSRLVDDWNWLALAQHHGLPTRLLDWTYNPLVAAHFASQQSPRGKKAGVVYAMEVREFGYQDELPDAVAGPFNIEKDLFLRTPTHIPRLKMQKGIFSVHSEPNKPFASKRVTKFEINAENKIGFQRLLYNVGVDAGFLMADLDGLCSTLKWRLNQGFLA